MRGRPGHHRRDAGRWDQRPGAAARPGPGHGRGPAGLHGGPGGVVRGAAEPARWHAGRRGRRTPARRGGPRGPVRSRAGGGPRVARRGGPRARAPPVAASPGGGAARGDPRPSCWWTTRTTCGASWPSTSPGAATRWWRRRTPRSRSRRRSKLGKASLSFLLVTDLGMPTSGGSSFQGGFEVVKRLWKMNLQPARAPDDGDPEPARCRPGRGRWASSNFVFKPGLSKLDPEQFEADLRAFAGKILADVLPRLSQAAGAPDAAARKARRRERREPRARPALPGRRALAASSPCSEAAGGAAPPPGRHADLRPGDEGGAGVLRAGDPVPGEERGGPGPGRLRPGSPRRERCTCWCATS